MTINPNSAADNLLSTIQTKQAGAASTSQQQSSEGATVDPSLQQLTDPISVQDADWALEDEAGAGEAVGAASQFMANQLGLAMTAQGNQLSENVFSLLQSVE
jgi:flagellin-like hook-associated protein FlgL